MHYRLLLASLATVLLATGCSKQDTGSTPSSSQGGPAEIKIAVIPKGTTHEFWKSIHAGAVKAQREFAAGGTNVQIIWKGPIREDDRDQQIQVVENFIGQRVQGMVLAPLDSQALVAPVETASRAKIPVVIIDSGLNGEDHVSFVATDNYKGGVLAAREMGRILEGKGKVIVLRYQVGSASTDEREAGFIDTLKKEFPDIQLISDDQYSGATRDSAYQASQNLLNRFGNEVQGVFGPCEPVAIGLMLALKDIGKAAGQVKVVGFDAGTQSVEGLAAGDIQALIVQDPVRMGYLGVVRMMEHLAGSEVPKRVDTGVHVVTRDNMEEPEIHALLHPPLDEYLN